MKIYSAQMKEYLKNELKHLPLILVMLVLFYGMTVFAVSIFQAQDADYDNSDSGIVADRAQGAIDELHSCAVNYQSFSQRFTNVRNLIGVSPLTTTSQNLIGAINEINNRFDSNGVLKITNGGTGAATAAGARAALDIPDKDDIPSVGELKNIVDTASSDDDIVASGLTGSIVKYGRVVTLRIHGGTFSAKVTAGSTIATLPEEYWPAINMYLLTSSDQNGNAGTNSVLLQLNTDGTITTNYALSSGKLVRFHISYISAS